MSSIAFHEPTWTVRVSGRERAIMGGLCSDMLQVQLGDFSHQDLEWVQHVAKPGHYLYVMASELSGAPKDSDRWYDARRRLAQSLETWFRVGNLSSNDIAMILKGEAVDPFTMALNSAVSWGNECVQLAAKLHGQCEIHAYCEGKDRAWLAALIERTVSAGVFHSDPWGYDGWVSLCEHLRRSADAPVVTSYSVCESFPNPSFAPDDVELDEDDPYEAWSNYSEEDHWRWGMEALREEASLQISPDRIGKLYGNKMTGAEFMQRALAEVTDAKTERQLLTGLKTLSG